MTRFDPALARRLQIAGILIAAGLSVEALTLHWSHPVAFLAFLLLGGALLFAGVALYLLAIVSR